MQNKESLRFAILFTEKLDANEANQQLDGIFRELWNRKVLNIIIIFWTTQLRCVTYSPFDEHFLIPLNVTETRADRLFFDKLSNMNGQPLKVGLFFEPSRAEFKESNFNSSTDLKHMKGLLRCRNF